MHMYRWLFDGYGDRERCLTSHHHCYLNDYSVRRGDGGVHDGRSSTCDADDGSNSSCDIDDDCPGPCRSHVDVDGKGLEVNSSAASSNFPITQSCEQPFSSFSADGFNRN